MIEAVTLVIGGGVGVGCEGNVALNKGVLVLLMVGTTDGGKMFGIVELPGCTGSRSNELGSSAGKQAAPCRLVRHFLIKKQAMLNSFRSSLPSLFISDRFQMMPSTLTGRPDFRKKALD